MTGHVHVVLGATATAVALAACIPGGAASPTATVGDDDTGTGLVLDVPSGFTLDQQDGGLTTWLGPAADDGTRVGITATRLCEQPRPTWQDVVDAAEVGEHTGWDDDEPTTDPVPVEVPGAAAGLRARGRFTLPVATTDERVEVVYDELLLRDPAGVVHRVRVEGAADAVADLDLDALLASVAVAEPGCPT